MATTGLDVSRLINVDVTLTPQGASVRNFSLLLIIGDSSVIDGTQRIRSYSSVDAVAADFGTLAPEYTAAVLYFAQTPTPREVLIGRWLRTATSAFLNGGVLSAGEQLIANWTPILDGTFTIFFDGAQEDVIGLDFSVQTNLNGVASVITAALSGGVVTFDGSKFIATSNSTGALSTVSFATPQGTGTDMSAQLKLDSANASIPVIGFDPESAEEAVIALYNLSSDWYMVGFAASVMPVDADFVDIAGFIQAGSISRLLFVTDTDVRELDSTFPTSISTLLQDLLYDRSAVQYSQNEFAAMSIAGLLAGVDFTGTDTAITVMYKTEPGVIPEIITEEQADTLRQKRANVFVGYNTNNAIIQYGVMSYNLFIDERQQFDFIQSAVQIAVFNLLLASPKVGQTDAGMTNIINTINAVFSQSVINGIIAPGVWNGPSFGNLETGQHLQSGYYTFAPPVSSQPQVDREARISVPIQSAIKLAGAIHTVDILINVNR